MGKFARRIAIECGGNHAHSLFGVSHTDEGDLIGEIGGEILTHYHCARTLLHCFFDKSVTISLSALDSNKEMVFCDLSGINVDAADVAV